MQFLFADHTLDTDRRELRRGSEPLPSSRRSSTCWFTWCENRDRVVSKDDLIASVWGGRIVSDSTLTSRINAARKAVGDSGEDAEADPHHRAQGVSLRRRRAHAGEWRRIRHATGRAAG